MQYVSQEGWLKCKISQAQLFRISDTEGWVLLCWHAWVQSSGLADFWR